MEGRCARVLFTIYTGLICLSFIFVYVTQRILIIIPSMIAAIAVLYFLSGPILKLFRKLGTYISSSRISAKPADSISAGSSNGGSARSCVSVFLITSLICLAVMMIWFAAYRPGSFQGDCIAQYRQALTGVYDDWHPVWHTLVYYTLPLKLTGGAEWSMTVFQIVKFSLVTGLVSAVLYKYGGKVFGIAGFLYMILNPYTAQFMLYPWKDAAFAISCMFAVALVIILLFEGADCRSYRLLSILIGISLACASIYRHNGILFTLVLMIALAFCVGVRRWLYILIPFILIYALIRGPVYSLLGADRTPQPVLQKVGVPMNIIAGVASETPERLDDETADFVYSIAPPDTWAKDYELGNFGIIKYYCDIDETPIENAGAVKICSMAARSFVRSPAAGFRAFCATADIVYGPDIKDRGYIGAQIESNDLGLVQTGNERIAAVLETYYKLVRLHGYDFFRQSACSLLLILCMLLATCRFSDGYDRKKILICLSVFAYNFGTMLLLTGPDSRFFYVTYLICPMMMILAGAGRHDLYMEREKAYE